MKQLIPFLLLLCSASDAMAGDVAVATTVPAQFRLSYDNLSIAGNEKMGLMGATLLYRVGDYLEVGPGTYGAITGQRGGFITVGLTAEGHLPLSGELGLNSGLFVGAGGGHGGYQLQGGGLMLRGHAGLDYAIGEWGRIGAGMSYVDFPNGSVQSSQPFVYYDYPFNALINHGWPERQGLLRSVSDYIDSSETEFAVAYREYRVPQGVMNDSGQQQYPTVQLIGVEWTRFVNDFGFVKFEAEGPIGGKSSGYMQILMGGGLRWILTGSTAIKLSAEMGVAGGGSVSTGGGLLLDASAAIQQILYDGLYLELGGSLVNAPDGNFRAKSINASLGYSYRMPDPSSGEVSAASLSDFHQRNVRLRFTQQNYLKDHPQWRNHHADLNVGLIGGQVDYFIADYLYLTGQGIAASHGQAGGYITGLIGMGSHIRLFDSPFFAEAEVLGGAAGGGGLDVAGGLVWQANGGIGYRFEQPYSLIASAGYISAPGGHFRAKVASLSVGYRFSFYTK